MIRTYLSSPAVTLKLYETVSVDLDKDKINDLQIKFANIWVNRFELTLKSLLAVPEAVLPAKPPTDSPKAPFKQFIFQRNLSFGQSGADVKELQKFLNARGFKVSVSGPGAPGQETLKFGPATRAAVIKFQKANNIKPAVGYFGPITRKKANGN